METTNRTKTNPFTAFGTPAKVFIDGKPVASERIADVLDHVAAAPKSIKAFTVSRINGVVKVYIARKSDLLARTFCFSAPIKEGVING